MFWQRLAVVRMLTLQLIESAGDPSKEAWIATDLDDDSSLPRDFLLGDGGRSRSNFINRPLRTTLEYRVFVRALGQDTVRSLPEARERRWGSCPL